MTSLAVFNEEAPMAIPMNVKDYADLLQLAARKPARLVCA